MVKRKTLPNVLIMLAAFVFFSANTVYFLEAEDKPGLSPMASNYQFDFSTMKNGPRLNMKAAILVDYETGCVLCAKNADEVRPIASISKLMTAMVLLDHGVDLNKTMTITQEDAYQSSRSRLRVGYELSVKDLLHAALMSSDNRAARAIARATSGSIEEFAKEMNRKARKLGLLDTYFIEPTGLSEHNVSTAHDVAKMLHYAYDYPLIREISTKDDYRVTIRNKKRLFRDLNNTNLLLNSKYSVLSGKTGYIRESQYCLATLVRDGNGNRMTAVVLGVPGAKMRFKECRKLLEWGFSHRNGLPTTHAAAKS